LRYISASNLDKDGAGRFLEKAKSVSLAGKLIGCKKAAGASDSVLLQSALECVKFGGLVLPLLSREKMHLIRKEKCTACQEGGQHD